MTIEIVELRRFTAFDSLEFRPSPGINVLIGANGTGKTHLMKVAYAACDVCKTRDSFAEKLVRVFKPSGNNIGRLVKRHKGNTKCKVSISRRERQISTSFSNYTKIAASASVTGAMRWMEKPFESVYVPVKEMLANTPGFLSLYSQRDIHFEEIYADILHRAFRPAVREKPPLERQRLLTTLQRAINGKIHAKNEEFFLRSNQGNLEFTLLAEGMRKLGLLWLLIRNDTLLEGSVLFWDEPETNLNPAHFGPIIEILLELQRMGVQIFIATHDYVILNELDLRKTESDKINFHALSRINGKIVSRRSDDYGDIAPNAIADVYTNLYDLEVKRSLTGYGK